LEALEISPHVEKWLRKMVENCDQRACGTMKNSTAILSVQLLQICGKDRAGMHVKQ
jgi:hypothetical protein